jgi:type III restriction enzyme
MNRHVNSIAGRLSLRSPQRRSLEILDRITEIAPPKKDMDVSAALEAIQGEFPSVTDFERDFPSLCFALATGVGKTRLMGAFISYLHLAHGINNFFVLAPNLTIYNKLITDFTPNTPKYVFKGIAEFATNGPAIITGDNYDQRDPASGSFLDGVRVNIFNISKINSEVRGGKAPRIKRLSEYIGQSYFDYLSGLPDLVLLMDESHRYRASAGVRAINELKPILGLELTATPFTGTTLQNRSYFKNVVFDYALGKAMEDGFVKEPAVVTRKDFNPQGMSDNDLDQLKLEDGVRLHEQVKVELETYARENEKPIVKPFVLVVAQRTDHAAELLKLIRSDDFFEGRYRDKVIQVDSSMKEEDFVDRLLKVEHTEEPTEIVIHVNMLQEGWDVTNLYTIIPLRAASAPRLIEQTIGRGLRLPYGKRTGVDSVDRLNIIAHDKFKEIIEEANKADSPFRLQKVILNPDDLQKQPITVISQPRLDNMLGLQPEHMTANTQISGSDEPRLFKHPEEEKVAKITKELINGLENQPQKVADITYLMKPEILAEVTTRVAEEYQPAQMELDGVTMQADIAAIVARTIEATVHQTISIPRILVVPKGEVRTGFKPFKLKLETLNFQPPSEDLWIQHLRTNKLEILGLGKGGIEEVRLEDFIVNGLTEFDDIAYDDHADLLYDLAGQTVQHFLNYLSDDDTRKVLRFHQREITRFIHAQMLDHSWEEVVDYEVKISKGFTELKKRAYAQTSDDKKLNFHQAPSELARISQYLFVGFERCLYSEEKFQSDPERKLAVILDRESEKWFRPAKGQFQIHYKSGAGFPEYQPDFVAETADCIYIMEAKAADKMSDAEVLAKRDAAVKWCELASDYTSKHDGKPWKYLLIPHDEIEENITLKSLSKRFVVL